MKTIILYLLLCLPFSLYSLSYEVYFNKTPSSDALDTILINKINTLPNNSTIELSIYKIDRANIIYALTNAASAKNITVNMIIEKNEGNDESVLLDAHSNITVKSDNNSGLMHNKFIIFDYKGASSVANMVWTGSLNLTDNGFDKNAQNIIVLKDLPIASEYSNEFYQMFRNNNYGNSKTAHTTHSFTVDGSTIETYFSPKDVPSSKVVNLINTANHTIYYCIFSFTDTDIIDALIAKHNAGVKVIGVCDDWAGANYGTGGIYTRATQANMPIYRDNVENTHVPGTYLLHHKYMIIDYGYVDSDPLVLTGSYNWTAAGNDSNDENMIVLHNNDAAKDYFYEFRARIQEAGGVPPPDPALSDTPQLVKNFEAYPVYPNMIKLKYGNPTDTDYQKVVIKASISGFVRDPSLGTPVKTNYGLAGESVEINYNNNLQLYNRYYFTAFAYDTAGNYSQEYASCLFFNPKDQGALSDNFIKPDDYNTVEIYFPGIRPVQVEVRNLYGKCIREIKDISSGKAEWNLKNEYGEKVGSGIYFLVYSINGESIIKKVLVAK